jgi:hypothetical protein
MAVDGHILQARLLQSRGNFESAEHALAAAEVLGQAAGVTRYDERVALARARLSLITNEAAAARWAGSWDAISSTEERSDYVDLLVRIGRARIHFALGTPADALGLLDSLTHRVEAGGLGARLIEIDVLRAQALHRLGRMAPAMMVLTIRGIARAVSLTAEIEQHDHERAVVSARATLDRRHFRIGPLPMGLTAGNKAEVRITLALTACRQGDMHQ